MIVPEFGFRMNLNLKNKIQKISLIFVVSDYVCFLYSKRIWGESGFNKFTCYKPITQFNVVAVQILSGT